MVQRRRVVGVVGSLHDEQREHCRVLGRLLADRGYDVLTTGEGGVPRAVAEAYVQEKERVGLSLAVCPGTVDARGHPSSPGCPNPFVELAIHTHLPAVSGRTGEPEGCVLVLVLSAQALVVLPGEEEAVVAAEHAERLGRPTLLFGPVKAFSRFPPQLERAPGLARVSDFLFDVFGTAER
ncbi:MAG: molybdenum cofactor carrier protein [Myxococcaceae bacterium]|nr:molybdenum cofactor carrier protein [Myxococcaceae bacterium]MCI0669496.1 molybdenum cofactor carrier protein [Myxococcaceae bacterium]